MKLEQIFHVLLIVLFLVVGIVIFLNVRSSQRVTGGSVDDLVEKYLKDTSPVTLKLVKKSKNNKSSYKPPSSNKQIEQFLKFARPTDYYDLHTLLSKFAKQSDDSRKSNDYRHIVRKLLRDYKDDSTLYKQLWKNTKPAQEYAPNEQYSYVARNYHDLIPEHFGVDDISKLFPAGNIKYLDVGCGTGVKTLEFGRKIGLTPKQIHGTDIEGWTDFKRSDIQFKPIVGGKLSYKDNEFDIITSFMTLHHVPDPASLISEIARCLKPGGIFLIREHNALDGFDKMLCDIEHLAYDFKQNSNHSMSDEKNNMNYHHWSEWDVLMKQSGLVYKFGSHDWSSTKETIGPTKTYHAIYSH